LILRRTNPHAKEGLGRIDFVAYFANSHILKDELIELCGLVGIEKCSYSMRGIEACDSETDMALVLLTNHLELEATAIATIYKDRW